MLMFYFKFFAVVSQFKMHQQREEDWPLPHFCIVERWHEETLSFHLPFGEITVTLYDVSCLLHLPIDGMLLSHESISRDDVVELMIRYLGSCLGDALDEVNETRGTHARFSYFRRIFKERIFLQLELDNEVVWRCTWRNCGTRVSANIWCTWWGSRSSLTKVTPLWMLSPKVLHRPGGCLLFFMGSCGTISPL